MSLIYLLLLKDFIKFLLKFCEFHGICFKFDKILVFSSDFFKNLLNFIKFLEIFKQFVKNSQVFGETLVNFVKCI